MNSFLISIIISIYNSEAYLKKCIDSVIAQTYKNIEIILIDDGSTDSSKDIIDEYAVIDKRIVAIHKENGGIGSAYKKAFQVMTGDYVLFADSDDWLEPNAIEELIELAIKNNADMVSFGIKTFNTDGEEVNPNIFKNIDYINTSNEAILETHFKVLKHPTLARLYKSKLFKDIVVLEQNIGIDELLTPQLLIKCNRAVYTSQVFYNVMIRNDSISKMAYNEQKINEILNVYRFICNFMDNNAKNYADIIYNKYLGLLFDIYLYLILNQNYKNYNLLNLIKKELIEVCKTIKIYSGFINSLKKKAKIFILIKYPNIYIFIENIKGSFKKFKQENY